MSEKKPGEAIASMCLVLAKLGLYVGAYLMYGVPGFFWTLIAFNSLCALLRIFNAGYQLGD